LTSEPVERRLAAVLVADVAGRLMGLDEPSRTPVLRSCSGAVSLFPLMLLLYTVIAARAFGMRSAAPLSLGLGALVTETPAEHV
jgi:hypothetical protein